jgi:hypothetical protein
MPRQVPTLMCQNGIERRNAVEAQSPRSQRRAALAIIGFTGVGWVTGSKATELARQASAD